MSISPSALFASYPRRWFPILVSVHLRSQCVSMAAASRAYYLALAFDGFGDELAETPVQGDEIPTASQSFAGLLASLCANASASTGTD